MGLSRNKVAVSEGAAGSPPFYGDRDRHSAKAQWNDRSSKVENKNEKTHNWQSRPRGADGIRCVLCSVRTSVIQLSGTNTITLIWGCSSAGRAPALQAGGQGFDSLHLHHRQCRSQTRGKLMKTEAYHTMGNGLKSKQPGGLNKWSRMEPNE